MFSMQMTKPDHWVQDNVGAEERDRIFAGMIDAWKTDKDLRKQILEAEAIPPVFADREVPGMMGGMRYVLEDPDYPLLFALFKKDTSIHFHPGTPAALMDQIIEEAHAVFRLLRAKARACQPQ